MKRKRGHAAVVRQELAGLYVRVSLDRSAHGLQDEILSPETQEDRSRQYCGAQDWAVAAVERDIDESAFRRHYSHRVGLMRLLEAVERGDLTKLVVWKFSRLSRRLKEFIEICDRVEAGGAGVVSVTEQVDTSTPAGRLIRNILASFAQFQSEEIGEQIFESWMTKARRGERPPGFAPFGTMNRKGLLEADPATHGQLMEMFRVYRATGSVRAVWDDLSGRGVPAPRGGEWSLNTIRGILANPVYVGRLDWAGESYQARWEPLVPVPLWEEVQGLMGRWCHGAPVAVAAGPAGGRGAGAPGPVAAGPAGGRGAGAPGPVAADGPVTADGPVPAGTRPSRARRDARLLTGFIRCGLCGRPLWTRYAKRSAGGRSYLRRMYWCCTPSTLRRGCPLPLVDAEEVEATAWDAVTAVLAAAGVGAPPGADRRQVFRTLAVRLLVMPTDVQVETVGLRVKLKARRVGETLHFGGPYQRLDWPGPGLTDRQLAFLRRTYAWAGPTRVGARLGRSPRAVAQAARRMGVTADV